MTGAHTYSHGLYDTSGNTAFLPGEGMQSGSETKYALTDRLGSTRALTSKDGVITNRLRYDAWGKITAQSSAVAVNTPLFAGGFGYEREPDGAAGLGLDYLTHRYYDPQVGRFISRDPIGYSGGLNLYGYCDGNPVSRVDPLGLQGTDSVTANVTAALRAGNLEEAVFIAEQAALNGSRFAPLAAAILANPQIQRVIQSAYRFQPWERLASTNLPHCQLVANRLFYPLRSLGLEKVQVYLVQPQIQNGLIRLTQGGVQFRFHYYIRYGNRVFDSLTGASGQNYANWVRNFERGGQAFNQAFKIQNVTHYFESGTQSQLPLPGFQ